MAQVECTGTVSAVSTMQAEAIVSAYLWCDTDDIQTYLDTTSTIRLGDNYDLATAKRLENDKVNTILNYLSTVFTIDVTVVSAELIGIATQLTAVQIVTGRMASVGGELAQWVERLNNDAWARLQRIFLSQTLVGTGFLVSNVPLWKRLILAKTRERAIVPDA